MAQKLSNLPNRALIKFGKHQVNTETAQPIIWMIADKNHSGYPANSITLITEKVIDFRVYDEKEGSYGNPNYKLSNIHQWLNSEASAGKWYTATHSSDAPPSSELTAYTNRAGFLYNFTATERSALLPTSLTIQTGTSTSEVITANVFFPSRREILGTGDFDDGSSRFSCFITGEMRAKITSQAYTNTALTSKPSSTGYWYYYLRNLTGKDVYTIDYNSEGISTTAPHSYSCGIRPVINLPNNLKVSDTTDSDGCYTVLAQTAPTISGSNTDLGNKSVGFSHTYSVNDAESDAVTVTEYIDNVSVRSYVATRGANNTFAVTGNTWLKLANGAHTLKITATDGFDTTTRTITFLKSVTKLVVQRVTPIKATTRPSQMIVSLVKNIPAGAILTVEVCNNGFDTTPTWETLAASSISSGLAHEFANTSKESGKDWGVNIRVTVDRNGAEGACYISEIGGNFE